jgi:tryptophan-rich sensory protein
MGIWTLPDVVNWFPKLDKPRWTPPRWFFPVAWSTLYTMMGVAAHRVWTRGGGALPLGLYGLQLALNLAWQPLVRARAAAARVPAALRMHGR